MSVVYLFRKFEFPQGLLRKFLQQFLGGFLHDFCYEFLPNLPLFPILSGLPLGFFLINHSGTSQGITPEIPQEITSRCSSS